MKWYQHLMAKKQAITQSRAERKAKIAKGKSLTSEKDRKVTSALRAASVASTTVAGFRVGVNYGNKMMNQAIKTIAIHSMKNGMNQYAALLEGIKVISVSSTAPYLAGALAITALAGGAAYAYTGYLRDRDYIKKAEAAEASNKTTSTKKSSRS